MVILGLLVLIASWFIFLTLAAFTTVKRDSVAEGLIIPPPVFSKVNFYGKFVAWATQSTTMFSS